MTNEQEKTLEVLRFAVQMEIDGKEYYEKASKASGNKLGKKLFQIHSFCSAIVLIPFKFTFIEIGAISLNNFEVRIFLVFS